MTTKPITTEMNQQHAVPVSGRCSSCILMIVRVPVCVVENSRRSAPGINAVHSGTASPAASGYSHFMEFTFGRETFAVAWVALVCLVGLGTGAAFIFQWVVLASLALIPPVLARTLSRASVLTPSPHRRAIRR